MIRHLRITQFCVLKMLQNGNSDCQMREYERISYGSNIFLDLNILTGILHEVAGIGLQFFPPALSDRPVRLL